MNRLPIFAAAAIGVFAALLLAAAPIHAQTPALPELPEAIQPSGLKPYLAAAAKGVQIYVCKRAENGTWSWAFKAPEAELFDSQGAKLGKHYAGPTWEGLDGGKVAGALKASAAAPAANAVSWLLLDVKSREGAGAFTEAKGIIRASTAGGVAPSTGCDEAHTGAEARIDYTATYYFLK